VADLVHVEDDIRPSRGLTMCGLPIAGRTVYRSLPPKWRESITCRKCYRALCECMDQGNPR
jgi:hypothetical protein